MGRHLKEAMIRPIYSPTKKLVEEEAKWSATIQPTHNSPSRKLHLNALRSDLGF